jgi:hypothetical protein
MAYITESRLSDVLDLPVALPATELRMGDWLIAVTFRLDSPMTLSYRFCNFYLMACTVPVSQITTANKIYPSLGLAYVVLRKDYQSGNPGVGGALDTLIAPTLGLFSRTPTLLTLTEPGYYSWILANNTQPVQSGGVPSSTSIDMRMSMTGQVRLTVFPT